MRSDGTPYEPFQADEGRALRLADGTCASADDLCPDTMSYNGWDPSQMEGCPAGMVRRNGSGPNSGFWFRLPGSYYLRPFITPTPRCQITLPRTSVRRATCSVTLHLCLASFSPPKLLPPEPYTGSSYGLSIEGFNATFTGAT